MTRTRFYSCIAAILGLALCAGMLLADEEPAADTDVAPVIVADAASASEPATLVIPVEPAAAAELQEQAESLTPAESAVVADSAANDVRALATGEATSAEVGRDSAKAIDLGATWQIAVLGALFAAIVSPWTAVGFKRAGILAPELASGANLAIAVGYYLLAWWLLHGRYPDLPQDPLAWAGIGLAGGAVGGSFRSVWRNLPTVLGRVLGRAGGKR